MEKLLSNRCNEHPFHIKGKKSSVKIVYKYDIIKYVQTKKCKAHKELGSQRNFNNCLIIIISVTLATYHLGSEAITLYIFCVFNHTTHAQ